MPTGAIFVGSEDRPRVADDPKPEANRRRDERDVESRANRRRRVRPAPCPPAVFGRQQEPARGIAHDPAVESVGKEDVIQRGSAQTVEWCATERPAAVARPGRRPGYIATRRAQAEEDGRRRRNWSERPRVCVDRGQRSQRVVELAQDRLPVLATIEGTCDPVALAPGCSPSGPQHPRARSTAADRRLPAGVHSIVRSGRELGPAAAAVKSPEHARSTRRPTEARVREADRIDTTLERRCAPMKSAIGRLLEAPWVCRCIRDPADDRPSDEACGEGDLAKAAGQSRRLPGPPAVGRSDEPVCHRRQIHEIRVAEAPGM